MVIDKVLGLDWSAARYVGDGVYLLDSTDYSGIPSVAIRTDRGENEHHVIVLEAPIFRDLVKIGEAALVRQENIRRLKLEGVAESEEEQT